MALVGPGLQLGRLALFAERVRATEQPQAPQVAVVQAGPLVGAAQVRGEAREAGTVQARQKNRALLILEESATLLGDGCAFGRANTEYAQAFAALAQGLANALAFLLVH